MLMTPCQGICKMTQSNYKCIGCHRTLEEIANWQHYTDEQRLKIMDRVLDESFSNCNNTNNR